MTDYDQRAETLGLNTKDEIKNVIASHQDNFVFLDVRGEDEVAEKALTGHGTVLNVPCTRDDASLLSAKAGEIFPDKNGKSRHLLF